MSESIPDHVIVIPARMHGNRLPGKPLVLIAGKPMIQRVWDRCASVFPRENIFVATEDSEIENYCNQNDINCLVTQKANSAIDRIYLFSKVIKAKTYINVQGEKILAFISTQNMQQEELHKLKLDLNHLCRKLLSPFKVPSDYFFYDEIPKTASGKLIRRKVKEQYLSELRHSEG